MEIRIVIRIVSALIALLTFIFLRRIAGLRPGLVILRQYEVLSGLICEKQQESSWYQKTEKHLIRNGAGFHYGAWITPMRYLVLRLLLAMMGLLAMGSLSMFLGVLTAFFLYMLPDWLLFVLNRRDNSRMLPEIKLIYNALEIQIKAGVYVTDALAECYGSVRDRRLQQALLDLAGSIVLKADIYEALDSFQQKFDNRHIDSLCITILQACESGQAVELLRDIGEQLRDMEAVVMSAKKNGVDRSVTFYQLGILLAVLGVITYVCVSSLFAAAVNL